MSRTLDAPPAPVNDAHDEPDTGVPPCDFCRRIHPCGCSTPALREAGDETCMCTCGRCQAPYTPEEQALLDARFGPMTAHVSAALLADMRLVKLRVRAVPWMDNYHGREAHLIDQIVDALEMKNAQSVAYVDDRDGYAGELAEAIGYARRDGEDGALERYSAELRDVANKKLLHGEVVGVRMML